MQAEIPPPRYVGGGLRREGMGITLARQRKICAIT